LNDERFIADAFALVAEHPRSVSRICFEITESVAVSDIENTLRFVNRVRELGAKVALDDFGVGYTSFAYLHSLSADVLKIDGSLVSAALAHPANLSIIEAISNLSSNLGMTSVAEWAGDLDTVKAMVEVGIDYVQSYAVGRPQMPESIVAARSAADFIQDKQIEEYVRKTLAVGRSDDMWPAYGRRKEDLH
jgi:EAL domain-containing protein (putative c-di-GMP-specific phosphodiesterase class I)